MNENRFLVFCLRVSNEREKKLIEVALKIMLKHKTVYGFIFLSDNVFNKIIANACVRCRTIIYWPCKRTHEIWIIYN